MNANGEKYEGDWVDWKMDGKCKTLLYLGIYSYKNGEKYECKLKLGKRDGEGILT